MCSDDPGFEWNIPKRSLMIDGKWLIPETAFYTMTRVELKTYARDIRAIYGSMRIEMVGIRDR